MEFWWWIEPLFYTGFIGLLLSTVVFLVVGDYYSRVLDIICLLLLVPLAIASLSTVIWLLCFVFWYIWSPYF